MNTTTLTTLWGSGSGPLRNLLPQTRIISGVLLGVACLAAPVATPYAGIAVSLVTVFWCVLSGMPRHIAAGCGGIALVLFLPFMLLTPWMTIDPASFSPVTDRLLSAGAIALRSSCCLFIAAATIATLPLRDIHQGLTQTPLPRPLALLIVQIITQTMLLIEETLRIIDVLRLRAGSGVRSLRVLFSFPVVWMVKILFRAERTAAAMTVRGYGNESITMNSPSKYTTADALTLSCSGALVVAVTFFRLQEFL